MAVQNQSLCRVKTKDEYCYFGKINHNEAADILLSEGGSEGLWLVRESSTSPENYVISVIIDDQPLHILIRQLFPEDPVFCLASVGDAPVFHGLDELIKHYKSHPLKPCSSEPSLAGSTDPVPVPYTLKKCCKGDPLPDSCKLHGTDNALHLAVGKGDLPAVQELLKSGHRQVDARNKKGLTAAHIACLNGNESIIKELLMANAKLKVIDSEGLSPLHYLCRINKASLLELLLVHDPSTIQFRVPSNGEVALHEAAASRSLACAEKLLRHGAPRRPRNTAGLTPEHLARQHHALDVLELLENYEPITPRFTRDCFLHGALSRHDCQRLLQEAAEPPFGAQANDLKSDGKLLAPSDDENKEGDQQSHLSVTAGLERTYFLIRASIKTSRHVLSLRYASQTMHFEILQNDNKEYYIDVGPLFSCLETLVDHYTRFEDGLPTLLTHPVPPATPPLDADAGTISSVDSKQRASSGTRRLLTSEGGELARDADASREDLSTSDVPDRHLVDSMSKTFEQLNMDGSPGANGTEVTTLQGNKTSEVCGKIDPSSLSLGPTLGAGEFGSVLKGVWVSPAGDQVPVAVKTLRGASNESSKKLFLQEAQLMVNLNHPYIVKLLGVCHGPPIAMVQELAPMGALLDYLLDNPNDVDPRFHLKLWPAQVALGMQYLEQKRFVHRDLACRNLLLSSPTLVKITDFGLSRATGQGKDYYTAVQGGKWPLKWYAPESINYGRFTHSSDVWSYGVTLWEMYTYGDQPYGNMPGVQVVSLLERGERLPQPEHCSNAVYRLMLRCWHLDPSMRPSFTQLALHFSNGHEYVDVKPYLNTKG